MQPPRHIQGLSFTEVLEQVSPVDHYLFGILLFDRKLRKQGDTWSIVEETEVGSLDPPSSLSPPPRKLRPDHDENNE